MRGKAAIHVDKHQAKTFHTDVTDVTDKSRQTIRFGHDGIQVDQATIVDDQLSWCHCRSQFD